MAIHPDMLEQARRFHQAGKLVEAERAYQQILQANGHDAEVWYQLGDTVLGQGRLAEAAERFRQARMVKKFRRPAGSRKLEDRDQNDDAKSAEWREASD